jgi:hypothetical protein
MVWKRGYELYNRHHVRTSGVGASNLSRLLLVGRIGRQCMVWTDPVDNVGGATNVAWCRFIRE